MKNLYEILEIDQNASQEIIEKAYKVLVKKYHPDLQTTQEGKNKCEEKIKQINEAYDIISNPDLRAEYDTKLQEEYDKKLKYEEEQRKRQFQQEQYENQQRVSQTHRKIIQNEHNTTQREQLNINKYQRQQSIREIEEQERRYNAAINKAYHDAYIQDLKNRGYKIRYKKTLNDYMHSLVALLITIGIIFLILQLPFVKNYLNELYQSNGIIRGIVDIISNLFK